MSGWEVLVFLLSPVAILIAAGLAWRKHRQVAARDATLKFIAEREIHNPNWLKARLEFLECSQKNNFPKDIQDPAAYSLWLVLHNYELVAVAIKNKSMDEELYKQWNLTGYINSWKRVASYVHARRQKSGQDTMYCEFEKLATAWSQQKATTK